MEVIKEKDNGAVQIYLSKEEVSKLINELNGADTEILKQLNNKLWNS